MTMNFKRFGTRGLSTTKMMKTKVPISHLIQLEKRLDDLEKRVTILENAAKKQISISETERIFQANKKDQLVNEFSDYVPTAEDIQEVWNDDIENLMQVAEYSKESLNSFQGEKTTKKEKQEFESKPLPKILKIKITFLYFARAKIDDSKPQGQQLVSPSATN